MRETDIDRLWDDAVAAAPDSHIITLENETVRVLEVVIPPGVKEPFHTHKNPSVMVIDSSASIRYYDAEGNARKHPRRDVSPEAPYVEFLEPEGLHAVENTDEVVFHATRIEVKKR